MFNKFKQIVFLICKQKPFISHFHAQCRAMDLARKLNTHVVDLAPKMIELHFVCTWREGANEMDGPTQMRGNRKKNKNKNKSIILKFSTLKRFSFCLFRPSFGCCVRARPEDDLGSSSFLHLLVSFFLVLCFCGF